jgi:hypothetical protein
MRADQSTLPLQPGSCTTLIILTALSQCACRKSNLDVLVMQTAENGAGNDAANFRFIYDSST